MEAPAGLSQPARCFPGVSPQALPGPPNPLRGGSLIITATPLFLCRISWAARALAPVTGGHRTWHDRLCTLCGISYDRRLPVFVRKILYSSVHHPSVWMEFDNTLSYNVKKEEFWQGIKWLKFCCTSPLHILHKRRGFGRVKKIEKFWHLGYRQCAANGFLPMFLRVVTTLLNTLHLLVLEKLVFIVNAELRYEF